MIFCVLFLIKELINNQFFYPYNSTVKELAFALEIFKPNDSKKAQWWLQQQIDNIYKKGESIMAKNSKVVNTSKAKIYEAVHLKKDYLIDV